MTSATAVAVYGQAKFIFAEAALFISGAQRQPNGNTLICAGPTGTFFEVTNDGETVWVYQTPIGAAGPREQGLPVVGGQTFRAERYGPEHPGVVGQDLSPGWPIEIYPCNGDFDNDGTVGVNDLLRLLGRWGDAGGIEDVDNDGSVATPDLLLLLGAWGPC